MKNLSPIFFLFVVFGMSCKKDVTVHFHNTPDYTFKNFTVDSVLLGDIKPHKTSTAYYCEQVTCDCRIPRLLLTCLYRYPVGEVILAFLYARAK